MAPVLSLMQREMDKIRDDNHLRVVSIWQEDVNGSSAFRTGFVLSIYLNRCVVVTVREGLCMVGKKLSVKFQNGHTLEGTIYNGGQSGQSRLAAIILRDLPFRPLAMSWSSTDAVQCQTVVHIGYFHQNFSRLGVSSGSVGLVGHNVSRRGEEELSTFAHCCSQKQYMIGAPVCNDDGDCVGINISKKPYDKNMFFAMELKQVAVELTKLLGVNWEDLDGILQISQGQASGQAGVSSGQAGVPSGQGKGAGVKKRKMP